ADDRNYLESIGRQRIAEILRTAEVAESDATRAAEQSEAAASARGEVAKTNAQASVQRKQNSLRQIKAEIDGEASAEVMRATAAGARWTCSCCNTSTRSSATSRRPPAASRSARST